MKTKHGATKLTFKDVEEIRSMFDEGMTDTQIAKIKNVSRVHINKIRNGKRWNQEQWDEIPKVLIKSNDYREFTTVKPITLTKEHQRQIQDRLDTMNGINERMGSEEFQTNYHMMKFIEALTGRKPKKVHIEF